jgi:hypothetical protein
VKYPLFLSDFNENRSFKTDFQKNTQISNFMKIHPQGTQLFHVDGQMETDITKLIGASQNFAYVPKN